MIPILDGLGWPVFDVQVVAPEFKIGARKVDYALCHKEKKPLVLLKVKDLGKATEKGEKQLFEYAFKQGVPIAILTDGRNWSLYLPAGKGSFEERRFAQIDLIASDLTVAAGVLTNYLHRDEVESGKGLKRAWDVYEEDWLQKEAELKYPSVWRKLLSEPDPSLLELFVKEVRQETEVEPDPRRVAGFLRGQIGLGAKPSGQSNEGGKKGLQDSSSHGQPSLTFRGQTETFKSGVEAMVATFEKLSSENPEFCERFSKKF